MKNTLLLCLLTLPLSAQIRYYVDDTATGQNTGASWADAFTDLQNALAQAQAGDEIWVAEGTYLPTADTLRDTSFHLTSGVQLYGGFVGTETSPDERDWEAHPAILSGDIGVSGDSTDNSYTILYMDNPDSLTLVDGFWFRYGNAGYPTNEILPATPFRSGGAMYIMADWEAFVTVQNCRFEYNTARNHGGAVYVNGLGSYAAAPTFKNCLFANNTAGQDGGGMVRIGNSDIEREDFVNCRFVQNRSGRHGGGLYYQDAETDSWTNLTGCEFTKNHSVSHGSGAELRIGSIAGAKAKIDSCKFNNNTYEGAVITGALYFVSRNGLYCQELEINRCTFSNGNNSMARLNVLGAPSSKLTIINSRFENQGAAFPCISGDFTDHFMIINDTFINIYNGQVFLTVGFETTLLDKVEFRNISLIFAFEGSFSDTVWFNNIVVRESNFPYGIITVGAKLVRLFNSCTFVNNHFNWLFYPIFDAEGTEVYFNNCTFNSSIITYNDPTNTDVTAYINYCSFDNEAVCETNSNHIRTICGPGNLFGLDPMFRDTANGDYSLLPCSPLRNRGNNAAAAGILTDIAGMPRIQDGTVDIGAYETPALALAEAPLVQPACAGSANGSIQLTAAGACLPVSWQWSPPVSTGPELYGLPPGNYAYTLSDNAGIQLSGAVVVPEAPQPELSLAAQDILCNNGLGGALTASVGGGTAPFQYLWQPAAPDTAALGALPPGDYALTLRDANGCRDSAAATLSLLGALTLQVDGAPISCYQAADGWLSATPLTGAAPWTWVWQVWPGMESVAEPLGPGLYAVTVSDAYGCTAAFTFPPMDEPDSLWLTADSNPQTDLSQPDGSALVTTISGGTPGYAFDWNTGAMSQVITGLTAGVYTVTITDARGCTASLAVTVDLMTGTEQAGGLEAFVLYPNPAAEWVRILLPETAAKNGELQLYDAAGRRLHTRTLDGSPVQQLSLETLPAGPYRLLITRNGQVVWETGVVKR